MNRLGTWFSAAALVAVWTANAVWGLPTLEPRISVPRPRPERTPCWESVQAWESGRLELVARGEDPDAVFGWRPSCENW